MAGVVFFTCFCRRDDGPPVERKRLQLKPRSENKDKDDDEAPRSDKPSPFGQARGKDEAEGKLPPWKRKSVSEKNDEDGDEEDEAPAKKASAEDDEDDGGEWQDLCL